MSTITRRPPVLLAWLVLASCGSTTLAPPIGPPPRPETRATLVGARCARPNSACQCRDPDREDPLDKEDTPPAPYKRFEVRVGPIQNELWVTVDDMVLYKSKERATECFYVDLVPGKHAVEIRGHGEDGFGAVVVIAELSAGGPWWYATFTFDCGAGGLCDRAGLLAWQESVRGVKKNLHAPCGSTKVRGIEWQHGRMPDALHPADLVVDFVLDIYAFATQHPPGFPACTK
jgi:hypothetical protein